MNSKGRPTKTPDARNVCVRLPANLLEYIQEMARERAYKEHQNISTNDLIKDAVVARYGSEANLRNGKLIASEVKPVPQSVTQSVAQSVTH